MVVEMDSASERSMLLLGVRERVEPVDELSGDIRFDDLLLSAELFDFDGDFAEMGWSSCCRTYRKDIFKVHIFNLKKKESIKTEATSNLMNP